MTVKDGDLFLLKLKDIREQERRERFIKAVPLLRAARLPKYQPDLIDLEGYYQLNKN